MPFDLDDAIGAYRGKSEEELFSALSALTGTERENGNMDDTKLDEIYRMLSPMLTDAQRRKMEEVLMRLKQ